MTEGSTTPAADRDRSVDPLPVAEARALVERVTGNVGTVVVGKTDVVEDALVALLARGHLLLEDVPGVGKTMLARALAGSIDGTFSRVQFTPDLLPSDVTGASVFDEADGEFDFQPGPVFGNVVLGDEINRAPPKTQSALLEAMEEGQVTVDGEAHALPDPIFVVATQNAVERDRVYDLPVAEVDRFTKKCTLGYPDVEEEIEVLGRVVGHHPVEDVEPVADVAALRQARETTARVDTAEPVRRYVARLVAETRERAALGASPRGGVALLRCAQARAVLDGRDYVVPDDVKREAPSVLTHRVRADAGAELGGPDAGRVVSRALDVVDPEAP
ncbi:AAA family ATPase [Halarchaeum nitratireducens]|uniref:MoxR-like ATPase n=1 Tax=Halarchaeum nitratireducens TaxID=489913 RepID=A0A830G724_9EURY|nr:AAA family ATPase [Halarchaeum nitratireducens]GGN05973.1 MoxR-like ATPase [Halarchaeum nitratireducens]